MKTHHSANGGSFCSIKCTVVTTLTAAFVVAATVGVLMGTGIIKLNRSKGRVTRASYDPLFYGNLHPYLYPEERAQFGVDPDVDVIVIGAGIAGLAAAAVLQQQGGLDVLVIEARDMTGGRVLTVPFWDDFTELGAQWLYGTYTNPITALATFFGAPRALARSQLKLGENGALPVIHANASNAEADMLAGISSTAPSISFDALRVLLDTRYDSKASISSSASIEGFELRGPVAVSLGGLSNITQGLTNMINASRAIMLNAPVATIHVGDLNTTVDLVNGTSFSSQYVVCTLPLGVLQAGSVKFDPPLPEQADAVITNLGVSTVNPVHLWFDGPFWNPEAEQLTLRTQPTSGWKEFLSMYTFTGQPLLIGFPGSVASTSVEFMSDEAAVNTVLAALRQEYGTTRVPFPQAYMVTRWGLNPFARGTHSFYTPGTSPSNRSTLAEPVGGSLLFAGEAVSARHPSTMHGAFSSGIAQAARILAAMEFPDGGGASDQCLAECYESQDVSVPGSDDKQQLASNDCN